MKKVALCDTVVAVNVDSRRDRLPGSRTRWLAVSATIRLQPARQCPRPGNVVLRTGTHALGELEVGRAPQSRVPLDPAGKTTLPVASGSASTTRGQLPRRRRSPAPTRPPGSATRPIRIVGAVSEPFGRRSLHRAFTKPTRRRVRSNSTREKLMARPWAFSWKSRRRLTQVWLSLGSSLIVESPLNPPADLFRARCCNLSPSTIKRSSLSKSTSQANVFTAVEPLTSACPTCCANAPAVDRPSFQSANQRLWRPGVQLADLTVDHVRAIVDAQHRFGVTQFYQPLRRPVWKSHRTGLSTIASACVADPWLAQASAGIHLEGPTFNRRGSAAHPLERCQPPGLGRVEKLDRRGRRADSTSNARGRSRRGASLHCPGGCLGITVAIGHTAASRKQFARRSIQALPQHRIWAMVRIANFGDIQLFVGSIGRRPPGASLIVDGHHLPPK